jgi:hypothetical protein
MPVVGNRYDGPASKSTAGNTADRDTFGNGAAFGCENWLSLAGR